jgi:hypothetical protein
MGIAIIALVIACVIGWNASKALMSHGLIPTRKGQLPGMRRERTRYVLRAFMWAVIVVVVLALVAKH